MFLKISKRQRFVVTSVLLSLGLILIQVANLSWRYQAIALLTLMTYFLSAWSLKEGLQGIEWLTVLILPTFFTLGVGLFYFLVPSHWSTRVPIILIYGLGIYVLLLIENIFSVSVIRTIQLLRSAQAVGFLATLATAFFLLDTLISFKLFFWLNFLIAPIIVLPLIIQALWSVKLEEKIIPLIWRYSLLVALIVGEFAGSLSFWPVSVAVGSLALVSVLYVSIGLIQHYLDQRLFHRTINEYLSVGIIVMLVILLTTNWRG